jgi:uncharacterized membrane protein
MGSSFRCRRAVLAASVAALLAMSATGAFADPASKKADAPKTQVSQLHWPSPRPSETSSN